MPPDNIPRPTTADAASLSRRSALRAAVGLVLGVVLLGSIIYLLVLAAEGAQLIKTSGTAVTVHNPKPWLIAALAASALALLGWILTELGRLRAVRDARKAQAAEERGRADVDRSRQEQERLQRALDAEQWERERILRAWRSQRDWNQKLRGQIAEMQRKQGALGRHDDVRQMVLELTLELTEADKGILLSDRETVDGDLRVVCALGFDNDPQDSAIAQRFATEVIQRDTTIREDDRARVEAERRTAADEEVRNLLAIPAYLADEFTGVIVCANREGGFEALDDEVLLAVGDHAGAVLHNSRLHGDLRSAYLSTIRVLANAIELKDPDLHGHSDAVSEYVLAVADRLEFDPKRREDLIFASLLHDVGKLGISERILLKPAALTDEERSVINLHPRLGYQLVRQVPALESIAPAVLHHHERFDGDGYPAQLRGDAIPLEARIIAVADSFSAITSERPYSAARTAEEACVELERCAGGQFDPEVVRLFVDEVRRRPRSSSQATGATAVAGVIDPELEVHRADGDLVLGGRAFAITDSLTLLYSHRHFHQTARAEAQRAALQDRPFAVVVAELTDLATVNSSRGFAAGDAALQSVAAAAQRVAARFQGQAFRASGRKIAVIVSGADQATANELAAVWADDLGPDPEVRIGTSTWQPGESGEQVIERAARAAARAAARTS